MSQPSSPSGQHQILFVGALCHVGKESLCAIAKDKRSGRYFMKAGIKDVDVGFQMMDNFGVRAVFMDLDKPETARNAIKGVTKLIYFPSSQANDKVHLETIIRESKNTSLEYIIFISSLAREKTFEMTQVHFSQLEELLRTSGLKWTHLICSCFMEYFIEMQDGIKEGKITLPIGAGKFSPICISDVGEAVANVVLSSSDDFSNQSFVLTGPEVLSGQDIANTFSKIFGKHFEFLSPSKEEAIRAYAKMGMSQTIAEKFAEMFDTISKNELGIVTNDAQLILARTPSTFESVMTIHKNHFLARPPSICPL